MAAIGQLPHRAVILSISNESSCVITTTAAHEYSTYDFVRLTNLNGMMPTPQHGADQLNGNRYRIIVTGDDTFRIQDPITFEDIDSTNFPPYTEGGNVNLIENNFFYYGEA